MTLLKQLCAHIHGSQSIIQGVRQLYPSLHSGCSAWCCTIQARMIFNLPTASVKAMQAGRLQTYWHL